MSLAWKENCMPLWWLYTRRAFFGNIRRYYSIAITPKIISCFGKFACIFVLHIVKLIRIYDIHDGQIKKTFLQKYLTS